MHTSKKIAALLTLAGLQTACFDYATLADASSPITGRLTTDNLPEVGREFQLLAEDNQACDIHAHSQPGAGNISDANGRFYVWPHPLQRLPEKAAQGQTLCLLVGNHWYPIWHSDKHIEYGNLLCDRTAVGPWSCTLTEVARQLIVPTTTMPQPAPEIAPSSKL